MPLLSNANFVSPLSSCPTETSNQSNDSGVFVARQTTFTFYPRPPLVEKSRIFPQSWVTHGTSYGKSPTEVVPVLAHTDARTYWLFLLRVVRKAALGLTWLDLT